MIRGDLGKMSIRGVTTSESETFLGSLRLSNFLIDLDEFYEGKREREGSYICRIVLLNLLDVRFDLIGKTHLCRRHFTAKLSQITAFLRCGNIILCNVCE